MSANEYDPRHSHEPEIPPVLDDEGRCLVCALLVERDEARGELEVVRQTIQPGAHIDGASAVELAEWAVARIGALTEELAPVTEAELGDLDRYAARAAVTAIYSGRGELRGRWYVIGGLMSEVGRIADVSKKVDRDHATSILPEDREAMLHYAGAALWYLAILVTRELRSSFSGVARQNLVVLSDRQARGVLHGTGRDR